MARVPDTITPRENAILTAVIETYIATAQAVASRTVARKLKQPLSPASIRAVMAGLTERGYLEQPHTSAGRVPTAKAFRLYVESLVRIRPLAAPERATIQAALGGQDKEITATLKRATALVSAQCHQIGMILAPATREACLKSIDFAAAAEGIIIAVLRLEGEIVETRVMRGTERFSNDELACFANYLNQHFSGLSLNAIRIAILRELMQAQDHLEKVAAGALRLGKMTMEQAEKDKEEDPRLFVEGTATLLDHAEFADLKKMREILVLLEQRSRLLDLLNTTLREDALTVTCGVPACAAPQEPVPLSALSMVSAPYGGNAPRGVVSVIGPTRMDYARVVPVVDYIAKTLTQLLHARFPEA